jgi:hypothetical protein
VEQRGGDLGGKIFVPMRVVRARQQTNQPNSRPVSKISVRDLVLPSAFVTHAAVATMPS